jgi:hypothetical protein
MSSEIPIKPTTYFDGTHLTDKEVLALTPAQLPWATLTDRQWDVRINARAPFEQSPDRIPSPENLEQIKSLFDWVDFMHKQVRTPWGMAWIEIEVMLASFGQLKEWAESNPDINRRYRYRIDAPLDPDAQAPDHLPQDWEET